MGLFKLLNITFDIMATESNEFSVSSKPITPEYASRLTGIAKDRRIKREHKQALEKAFSSIRNAAAQGERDIVLFSGFVSDFADEDLDIIFDKMTSMNYQAKFEKKQTPGSGKQLRISWEVA